MMRIFLALIVIIYFVGVGVALSPTVHATTEADTASTMATKVAQALPMALAWPERAANDLFNGPPDEQRPARV